MGAYLLTGAGFSRNWGGWLAREVNSAIAMRIRSDSHLSALLQRLPNFEEALAELQTENATTSRPEAADRLQKVEDAIVAVFEEMNRNLVPRDFNFCNDRKYGFVDFLALFDAIFTLNQDLLLEKHYHDPQLRLSLTNTRTWAGGGELPGTVIIPGANGALYDPLTARRRPVAAPVTSTLNSQCQPYFKLHGSMNWQDPNGGRLLVMGGNKPTVLQRHPILMWYAAKFEECLSQPNARLVVIGYGFRDLHINRMIVDAWEKGGKTLSMFIVQPEGRDILRQANPTYGLPIYCPEPIEAIPVFDATRGLPAIFGGNEPGQFDLLTQYVKGQ
jgi:hypothetical protein